jgi:hypothetical protein
MPLQREQVFGPINGFTMRTSFWLYTCLYSGNKFFVLQMPLQWEQVFGSINALTTISYYLFIKLWCTVYYRLCLRLRAALLYVGFSLLVSFTTCFGLLGHLLVCTCLHIFEESASLLFGYVAVLCRVCFSAFWLCGRTLHVSHLWGR